MSDTDGKIKLIRNPDRDKPTNFKPYVPQYQVEGIEPEQYQGAVVPSGSQVARPSADNPRLKKPALRQPYTAATTSPIGRGRGPVPNVGNNMEHTWSSVDGDIVDDLTGEAPQPERELVSVSTGPNAPFGVMYADQVMIDNNDFVTEQALGYQSGFTAEDIQGPTKQGTVLFESGYSEPEETVKTTTTEVEDLLPIVASLADDSFLLIVSGVPLCSGPKEEIEDQARALVFGEHEMCDGNPTPIDDIIILKRVKVKVGLFLE